MKANERLVFFEAHSMRANASVVFPDLAEPHIGIMPVPIESSDGSFRRAIVLGAGRQVLFLVMIRPSHVDTTSHEE